MAGKTRKEIIKGLPGFCCFYLKKKKKRHESGENGEGRGEGKRRGQIQEEVLIQAV